MTRPEDDREQLGPEAAALLGLAQRSFGEMTSAQHARGLAGLRARRAEDVRRSMRWRLAFGTLGAAAAVAGAWIALPRLFEAAPTLSGPLGYQVERAAIADDGTIRPTPDAEPALKFEDGTVIELARGTVGRLAKVDGRGARVSIANGTARVNVVPKPKAEWLIDAGPFLITVHGTVFTAAWNEADARLEVRLSRGLVSVSGPVASGPVAVRAGQRLTISLRDAQVLLRKLDDGPEDEGETFEGGAGDPPLAPARATEPLPPRPARALRSGRNWAAALSAGDFDAVLADAEKDLGRSLATRSSDDLAALADAARYRRHDDVARRALHAQRRRFSGSARAADAAFFLGRLDENAGGPGLGRALRWYDRYLAEAPNGSYAAEALGRKMVAVRELEGVEAARDIAAEYARRFPRGSYAGTARAIRVER